MEFSELKIGDKVNIVGIGGKKVSTEVIAIKGTPVKKIQVLYRRLWYTENEWKNIIELLEAK